MRACTVDGKLIAIPYRYASWILHYQSEVLSQAGINKPPQNFAELQDAAIAITKAGGGNRYGLGMYAGKEANALDAGFLPFLLSSGAASSGRHQNLGNPDQQAGRRRGARFTTRRWYPNTKSPPPEFTTGKSGRPDRRQPGGRSRHVRHHRPLRHPARQPKAVEDRGALGVGHRAGHEFAAAEPDAIRVLGIRRPHLRQSVDQEQAMQSSSSSSPTTSSCCVRRCPETPRHAPR